MVSAVAVGERHGRPVIVSGSYDGTVRVWDLASGQPVLGPLTGHEAMVSAVAVGERRRRAVIVSDGSDQTVRIEVQHQVQSIACTADGLVIGTAAELLRVDLL